MQEETLTPTPARGMTMTAAAAKKASELLLANNKENAAIRVFVKSGGCSGYSYGMAIDDRTLEGDSLFEDRGVKIVVDKMSLPLLAGSEIDYIENMMGGGFSVNNPNATSACGCGHSFRTDGKAAPDGQGASCH
ncbi:iron-sulfur cluster insertion protein ErpA [Truepera radiovictrix]|uniref:Iron-sulfur cluster assembly accessory protein n=1 Tax=Truepera radiovictrix (strain DSM 17093 / CIP 108686 / LMG 22925 / RQ-24) TaxID=649638 RepID=D7CVH6_TRURR|nr:iron-sulfur cluster insertion protein ErpA [Truepera radiovictrix]ADI14204.1 iron-sulfur cluster assembly accessory protein [Truepera radiovictrix DSM 17093]WMT57238.1 iron-sulfur cluster insertion protein ErpA [Truepera radiovictrix]